MEQKILMGFKKQRSLWRLFRELRDRRLPLGIDDYETLLLAFRAGFGSTRTSMRDLCCSLWAKTPQEREMLIALFEQYGPSEPSKSNISVSIEADYLNNDLEYSSDIQVDSSAKDSSNKESAPKAISSELLPDIPDDESALNGGHYIFVPQFPITYREVAQAWRRLRRPLRTGPPIELDIDTTITQRYRSGIMSATLIPRRRNITRLLILVDQQGSMSPFHWFIDHIITAIRSAANLGQVVNYYFHDTPAHGADRSVLAPLADQAFPRLDSVLSDIRPLKEGFVFKDRGLSLEPLAVAEMLHQDAVGSAVVIISDAGAVKDNYDLDRILDTTAFLKALHIYARQIVWINPLPPFYWSRGSAKEIQRYVPMFPLNRQGMYEAVNVLRGRPYPVEKTL